MNFETRLTQYDPAPGDPFKPTSTPIYQSATFEQESATEFGPYDYSRSGNPTRDVLQTQLANLDNGKFAFAYSSGMAATATLTSLVKAGEEVLIGHDIYGGTYRFMERVAREHGVSVTHVDTTDLEQVRKALNPKVRLAIIESPSNPMLDITDIRALSGLCHEFGTWLAVDNTLMSPYLQRPLELGADVVIHSATKALSGHADFMSGALVCNDDDLGERLAFRTNAMGTALGPFECFLLMRGMKTLAIRMEAQQKNAAAVAAFLRADERVEKTIYTGFEDHPGFALHQTQATGAGPVLSIRLGTPERAAAFVAATRLFHTTVSFGSLCSTISLPYCMSHASIPEEVRKTKSFTQDLVRLSVGIENAQDLIEDLDQALAAIGSLVVAAVSL